MKYSITVLQAEITRFENGIKARKEMLAEGKIKDKKLLTGFEEDVKHYETQIKELKADIAKL
ncbi:hypothetical protein LCGC14_0463990 [marine sediment metagenome]|uniref:Uncharacterized protein n=1 Tax=marine sediment metagenome TaxID=412755 RepID=A0A0F9V137_9ZZZZ